MTRADRWDPLLVRERRKEGYRFGFLNGPQTRFAAGPKFVPEAHSYFFPLFLFFFCFLYSFITISNLVQIDSNQFVNFPKIQLNNLRQ
jgi:hypothetical protein